MVDTKMKAWQTKGDDGKVYGLLPVADWADWFPEDDKVDGYPDFTPEQQKQLADAMASSPAADTVKAAKPDSRKKK